MTERWNAIKTRSIMALSTFGAIILVLQGAEKIMNVSLLQSQFAPLYILAVAAAGLCYLIDLGDRPGRKANSDEYFLTRKNEFDK